MFIAADAGGGVSAGVQIALALISAGTVSTFLGVVFGRRKSNAEVEGIAQKTTAAAIELYRTNSEDTISDMRKQLVDLRTRVEVAERKGDEAENRADRAERRASDLSQHVRTLSRALAEYRARHDYLEQLLALNNIFPTPWTPPKEDDPALWAELPPMEPR